MKIIVTGGAGFIGGNFVEYMLKYHPGYDIICVDCLTYAGSEKVLLTAMQNPRFTFIKENITNRTAMDELFRQTKPDVVINFAAESHVDRAIEHPEIFLNTNVIGTSVLMDICVKYGISRFHQVSTDEVYGELPLDRPDLMFLEESPICAGNPYSASKAGADVLVMAYHNTYRLPVTISRCSNNYGFYQHPEKLIPLFITRALDNLPLPLYGSGDNVRDWIFVEDHCRAIDCIIHKGKVGEIYNVGANNEWTNIDLAKYICEVLEKPQDLITFVEDRKGHDKRYAIDSSKIQKELGWSPQTTFGTGIRQTIQWYAKQKDR